MIKYAVENAKKYIMKEHPVRAAITLFFSMICFCFAAFYIQGSVKRLCIYAVLCLGGGLLCFLPRLPRKITIPAAVVYFLFVPMKIFQRFELPFHDMSRIGDGVPELTILLMIGLYLILFIVTQRVHLALGVGNILLTVLFLVEYFVHQFRGNMLTPNDISAVGTALTVIDSYQFTISAEGCYSLLYLIFFTILGFKLRIEMKGTAKAVSMGMAALAATLCFYTVFFSDYMEEKEIKGYYWNMKDNSDINGTILSFFVVYKESKMEVPAGYSAEAVARIAEEADAAYEDGQSANQPNIIMIMNEAWSDLRVVGDIETTESYMPFTDALTENTIKGNLYVSIKGGLTANTEFEALTGNTLALLSPSVIPYSNQVNHDMYSLARVLGERGYQTMAMHPSTKVAWSRNEVYEYFGFDEFIDVDKFETEYLYVRNFLSDECNYNEIIYQFENRDRERPFFLFDVTIQNHSGYYGEIELPIEVESVNGIASEEVGYTYDLQTYLNLMKISDDAFAGLIHYFEQVEEPTIICMFGDHQPILSDDFYNAAFKDRDLSEEEKNILTHITPYVIWANYDISEEEYGDISANYLPAVLLECADVSLPPFYQFLLNTKEEYPVLSLKGCIDSAGELTTIEEINEREVIQQYRLIQYNQLFDENVVREAFSTAYN